MLDILILFLIIGIISNIINIAVKSKVEKRKVVLHRKDGRRTAKEPFEEGHKMNTTRDNNTIPGQRQQFNSKPESGGYELYGGATEPEAFHSLLSSNGVLKGIVFSEILGPPKSRRKP